ncbi:MAG: VOC family protein [Oscillospiraceae bacterium]
MKVLGVNHVQINSSDIERSREFYEKAFGGKVVQTLLKKGTADVHGYMLELVPGSVLEIAPPRFPLNEKVSAWNTIAIETDDIEAATAQIEAAGGVRETGPHKNMMGETPILNTIIVGPDDEHIELIQLI